jgi:hypothetical protein
MNKRTTKILSKKIRRHMENNGLTFTDANPFPVSWRTIWSIVSCDIKNETKKFAISSRWRMNRTGTI